MLEFCRKLEKTLFLFPNFSRAVVSYAAPQPSETINMWELQKKKKKRERDAWVLSEDSHLVCLDENLLSAFSQVSMILIHSWFTNNWDHFQFICFPLLHFQFPSFMIDLPISASSCHLGQCATPASSLWPPSRTWLMLPDILVLAPLWAPFFQERIVRSWQPVAQEPCPQQGTMQLLDLSHFEEGLRQWLYQKDLLLIH